jgi:hypothetical protein
MITSEVVKVKMGRKNSTYYKNIGYIVPMEKDNRGRERVKRGTTIDVKIIDIQKGSATKIPVKCEYCGEKRMVEYFGLFRNPKSCFNKTGETPCSRCFLTKVNKGFNNPNRKHIDQRYPEYRTNAKKRGIEFKITSEQFAEIVKNKCHYCDGFSKDRNEHSRGNGIDRKDNTIGYVYENCVPCCATCNFIKNNMGYKDFINYIKQVYNTIKKYEMEK